jgi:hypothetical protein
MIEDLAFREWCREKYYEWWDIDGEIAMNFKKIGDLLKDVIVEDLGLAWRMRNPKYKHDEIVE